MNRFIVGCLISAGLLLAACSNTPTKEEFATNEAKCVQWYCASNAPAAEVALLELESFTRRCQEARVEGIPYDEVFGRIYGRLYLVERHLNHSKAAEHYLEKYAHYHAVSSTLARQMGRPHGEMERLIVEKYDDGLTPVWRNQ